MRWPGPASGAGGVRRRGSWRGERGYRWLRLVDRVLVAALCSALPAHFRARQRAEWTADLLALAGGSARWRYLLGAAWTLPTLRALARRAQVDGPPDVL